MTLPESYWPKKKLGSLSPTNTVTEYEWYYFSIPRGVSTVAMPVGMEEFTPKEIQRVFAPAAEFSPFFSCFLAFCRQNKKRVGI